MGGPVLRGIAGQGEEELGDGKRVGGATAREMRIRQMARLMR